MKGRWISYTDDQLAWLAANRDLPRADLHAAFQQTFDRPDVSRANLTAICKRKGWLTGRSGQFPKGNTSHNAGQKGVRYAGSEKGWFKKGERRGRASRMHKPIGTERMSKSGYLERKINEDMPFQRRWRAVHIVNWEAIHGPLPAGMALKSLDGNRLNTDPANWQLVPRALLPRLNGKSGRGYDAAPVEIKPTILAIARLEHKARQLVQGGTTPA